MIINLPKLGPVRFSDDMSQEQINARIQELSKKYDFKIPMPEYGVGETFTRGVKRGITRMGSTFGDVIPAMVGSALGFDDYAKRQMEEAAETQRQIQETNAPSFTSYKQVEDIPSALKYAAETIGETTPDIAGIIASGGIGGGLAKVGTRAATLGAEQLAARQATGQAVGLYLGSYAQNAPEVFQSVYQETGKLEPAVAALFGSVSAALDAVLPAQVLRGMTQPLKLSIAEKILERSGMAPSLLRKSLAVVPATAAKEGLTEGAQEAINIAAEKFVDENAAVWGSKEFERMIESSVRGMVAGGGFGTVGAAGERLRERGAEQAPPPSTETPPAGTQDEMFTPEQMGPEFSPLRQPADQQAQIDQRSALVDQDRQIRGVLQQINAEMSAMANGQMAVDPARIDVLRKKAEDANAALTQIQEQISALPELPGRVEPSAEGQLGLFQEVKPTRPISERMQATFPGMEMGAASALGTTVKTPEEIQDLLNQREYLAGQIEARRQGAEARPVALGNTVLTTDKELQDAYDALTTQAIAATEAAGKQMPTVLDANTLNATGLPKQSGFYKQLLGKDLTNLVDLDAVMQIAERAKSNKSLSADTKAALDSIATQAFAIYGQQAEMFGPRGGVLEPVKEPAITPTQKKIEQVTKAKDLTDPVQVEEVRAELTDYANGPTRSAEAIDEVSRFLDTLPSVYPEATNVIEPTEPVAPATEPSPELVEQRGPEPTGGVAAPRPDGLGFTPTPVGAPDVGAPVQSTALTEVPSAPIPARPDIPLPSMPAPDMGMGAPAPVVPATATPQVQAPAAPEAAGFPAVTGQPTPSVPAALEGPTPSTALTTETTDIIEGQTRFIDEETIAPAVAQLAAPEQQTLAEHYGEEVNSPAFLEKLRKDISDFATKGAQAVDAAIRNIIRKLHAAVLAAAVIMNPNFMSAPIPVAVPKTVTTIEQVKAVVPAEVAKNMSPAAQMAFANVFPSIQAELKAKNKFFVLTDKPNARVFIFTADGKPVLDKKVLIGKTMGDFYRGNTDILSNRITPAGLFTLGLRNAARGGGEAVTAGGYDFGKVFVLDKAIDGEYSVTLFHSVWTKEKDAKQRLAALKKEGAEDSRYSFGCINVDKESYKYLLDNYEKQMDGAKMFVVPDNPDSTMDFINGKAVNAGDITRQRAEPVMQKTTKTVPGTPSATAAKTQMAARKEEGTDEATKRALYRTLEDQGEGMPKPAVQKIVDAIVARWKNAPKINVVQDIQDLPEKLYQQMVRDNAFEAPGVYDPNTQTVHLIADNIPNAKEAVLTLTHEALGHFGIQSILGNSYGKVMDDIYNGNAKVREAAKKKIDAGLPKHEAVEEVLAEMAEAGVYNNAIQRIFNAIRQFFRKLGLTKNVSDAEVRALLANAQRFVVAGGPTREGSAAFRNKNVMYRKQAQQQFNSVTGAINDLPPFANDIKEGALNAFSKVPDSLLSAALGFMTMPQIAEVYGSQLPSINKLIVALENRATSLMDRRQHVSENIRKWYKIANKHKAALPKFFEVANKTTLDQIDVLDPAQANNPLTKEFKKLPQGLQDVYAGMRKEYDDNAKEFMDLLSKNLTGSAASKMRTMFESKRLKVYLPLTRQGDYWLTFKDATGERVSMAFESPRERAIAADKALKAGGTDITAHARLSQISFRTAPPTGFMGTVIGELVQSKVDPVVIDNIYQAYMSLFPAESLRQQFRTREGVAGFNEDVFQAYANVASKMAQQLSNLEYADPVESSVAGIRQEATETPTTTIRDVVENIERQLEFLRNPVNGSLVSKASYFSYMMYIAGNVSSAVVNLTQLPIVVFPLLGGKYGFDKATAAMQRATSMYYKGGKDNNSEFMPDHTFGTNAKGEYKQLYDAAVARAAIRRSTGYEITEARRVKMEDYTGKRAKIEHALGWIFQNSERANREITLIAAFDLARQNGLSVDQSIDEALKVVNDAHGASLAEIGPRFFQQGIGKVAFTFKRFAQSQIYLLGKLFNEAFRGVDPETKRIARRQLLGISGMAYAFAGIQGMPLYGAVSLLAEMMLGDDDEPFDIDAEIRAAFGDIGYKGPINQMLGVDIASRTGFNGLLWREDPKRLSEVGPTLYALEQAAGPAYGAFRNAERGLKLINQGEIERGMEALVPSFVRNGLKAFRLGTEGALTKDGTKIVDDISAYNTLMQVFGFNPAELAEAQARAGAMKTAEKTILERRGALLDKLDAARMSGDFDGVREVQEAINQYNSKNPGKRITPQTMAQSYQTRRRNERESVDGVTLDRKLRMQLMEEYGE